MSKSHSRILPGQIYARLPIATANRIAALAAADSLTRAAWVRRVLVLAAGTDPADAVPVAARALPGAVAPAAILEMVRLREVVAKLSGALVETAILVRSDAAAVLHAEVEAVLPGVRQAVRDLDQLKKAVLAGLLP